MKYRDSADVEIKAGAHVLFSYGIPPVYVRAKIVRRAGKLVALTPGHKPTSCPLHNLKRFVGEVYVDNRPKGKNAKILRKYKLLPHSE